MIKRVLVGLRVLAGRVHRASLVYSLDLPSPAVEPADDEWHLLDLRELDRLFADDPHTRDRFEQFLRQGHVGLTVDRMGEPLAYGFLSPGTGRPSPRLGEPPQQLPEAALALPWIHNCQTLPPYRGRGLYRRVVSCLAAQAAMQGRKRVFIDVDPENIPARMALRHLPFRPAGTIETFGIPRTPLRHRRWRRSEPHRPVSPTP